jgi:hypothetical protein
MLLLALKLLVVVKAPVTSITSNHCSLLCCQTAVSCGLLLVGRYRVHFNSQNLYAVNAEVTVCTNAVQRECAVQSLQVKYTLIKGSAIAVHVRQRDRS